MLQIDIAGIYSSSSQQTRVTAEYWVNRSVFCPNYGNATEARPENARGWCPPVAIGRNSTVQPAFILGKISLISPNPHHLPPKESETRWQTSLDSSANESRLVGKPLKEGFQSFLERFPILPWEDFHPTGDETARNRSVGYNLPCPPWRERSSAKGGWMVANVHAIHTVGHDI